MTRTEYAHYVIHEYLSVTMTCVFAIENYTQRTAEDANPSLRDRFISWMEEYEKIYQGRENWPISTEDLVDRMTMAHLRSLAEREAESFVDDFEKYIPSADRKRFDLKGVWNGFKDRSDWQISSAILRLVKELRKWEEDTL